MTTRGTTASRRWLTLALACALGAAVASILTALGILTPPAGGITALVCTAAAIIAGAAHHHRRRNALRSLADQARALFHDHPDAAPPARAPGDDLATLRAAIERLGERMRREAREVARKTRNLEALIAAVDEPLLATDNQDRVLLSNRSAEAIFDVEPGQLAGRPIESVITHAELLEMHRAARAGEVRRGRLPLTTPLGRRVFQVSASPVPVAWGQGVFGAVMVLRDVTELDHAVQVKTEFVANASHELRTPVAAIRTAAETLAAAVADDPAMAERTAKMIVAHAGRLEELLRDLLDLSRLESPDAPLAIESVDLGEVSRALSAMFEAVCRERRLRLVFDIEDDIAHLRTDRKLLMVILRNLIENAAKFAREGTDVEVSATLVEARLPREASPAPRSAAAPAPADPPAIVRFQVADHGIGIPLNQQDRVFERFYQVDPARTGGSGGPGPGGGAPAVRRGTGLGLAIVKHAAKTLGGRVGLNSVWGQGTKVWAEIPVQIETPASEAERRAS